MVKFQDRKRQIVYKMRIILLGTIHRLRTNNLPIGQDSIYAESFDSSERVYLQIRLCVFN